MPSRHSDQRQPSPSIDPEIATLREATTELQAAVRDRVARKAGIGAGKPANHSVGAGNVGAGSSIRQIPTDRPGSNTEEKIGAFRRLSAAFISLGRQLLRR